MCTKRRMTNVEFVTEMMEYSNYGGLVQAFVLWAIEQYAHQVVNAPPETFAKMNHFVSTKTWQGIAKELVAKFERRV